MATATTVSEELGSLTLCDQSSLLSEVVLEVSPAFAQYPLGFSLDAGGSVTKIVYRSKLDYTAGQPNNGKDIVRLRFFPNGRGDGDDLIKFLKDNVDVRPPTEDGTVDSEGRPLYYLTGVGIQHYFEKLEEAFSCRIKIMPEVDAGIQGVLHVPNFISQLKGSVPISVPAADEALRSVREFFQVMQGYQQAGVTAFGNLPPPVEPAKMMAHAMKLMTTDGAKLAEEFNAKPITYPCLFVQCGSATGSVILHENGKYAMGDFNATAGKTVVALGRLLTGAQNFEELIQLAEQGDRRKVDILCGDMKRRDRTDVDWYSLMPDQSTTFTLGKAADERYDGTYTKADLAAALIYMQCDQLVHLAANVARIHRLSSLVFVGSYSVWPLTQRLIQECFLRAALLLPLIGENSLSLHILPLSGFLTAFGTWYENIKNKPQ